MNKFLIVCAAVLMAIAGISQQAKAGATTFGYTAGSGTTFAAPTNGTGNLGAPLGTLCDGTALANCTAVKAASTAAVATDPAAVTTLSPNQPALTTPLNVGAAQTGTWTVQPGNTPNTTPWLATIAQGGNSLAVKAASTAAVATDPSGVTQLSPNQPQLTTPLNVSDTLNAVGHPDFVQRVAGSTGGTTPYHLGGASVSGTNAHVIDASPGMLYTLVVINPTTTIAYLRIVDTATTPTCSSGTGVVHDYAIPAASASGVAGGFVIPYPVGEVYATGISYCMTGAVGDTDTTPAPIGVTIDASYK